MNNRFEITASAGLLGCLLCLAGQVLAQPASAEATRNNLSTWQASFGLAHTRAQDGTRITYTPLELNWRVTPNTGLRLQTDGWGRVSLNGQTDRGFNNITLSASQTLLRDADQRLRVAVGLTIPAHGELGSRHYRQLASVAYSRAWAARWDAGLVLKATRRDGAQDPGVSRVEYSARARLSYATPAPSDAGNAAVARNIFSEWLRETRSGVGGYSELTMGYEWPLGSQQGLALRYSRGFTPGLRDNTYALDWLLTF
jgi:hypothetical protein